MSAETAFMHFIRPVMVAFKDPPSGDPEAFFAALGQELSGFTSYQLGAGARQLVRERTTRTFPTVAECIAVCARWPEVEPPQRASLGASDDSDLGASWRKRKDAYAMMQADRDLSRQASKEGWLGQLFDYAMEHGKMPPREAAMRLNGEASRVRGELSAVGGALGSGLIEAYRARYKMIQQAVFGED